MEKYVFGIDLGGTTVKLGLLSVEGELLDKWEIPTNTANGGATILQDIAAALRGKLNEKGIEKDEVLGAGMGVPEVEGATGYIDTNFKGKAECAVNELKNGKDFVYIHIEAPDECGHRDEPENKVRAIEIIDEQVLYVLLPALEEYDDYKIMILPDHPTPIVTKTHARDPVPYMIYHKSSPKDGVDTINEETAKATGNFIEKGATIMEHFLKD